MEKQDIEKVAKNFVSALNKKAKYNDCQNANYGDMLTTINQVDDEEPEKTDLEIAIENVLFGLKGTSNFTDRKQEADKLYLRFVQAFNTNYVIDESDLPEGITSETRIIFVVRLLEALIELLKFDLTSDQSTLVLEIIEFALSVLVDIAGNM